MVLKRLRSGLLAYWMSKLRASAETQCIICYISQTQLSGLKRSHAHPKFLLLHFKVNSIPIRKSENQASPSRAKSMRRKTLITRPKNDLPNSLPITSTSSPSNKPAHMSHSYHTWIGGPGTNFDRDKEEDANDSNQEPGPTPLQLASASGNLPLVSSLLIQGSDVNRSKSVV